MLRKIGLLINKYLYIFMHNLFLWVEYVFKTSHNYQPKSFKNNNKGRLTQDRYEALISHIDMPISMIDLGCNRGFFVLKMAKKGCFSIGIDSDFFEIIAARSMAQKYGFDKALFMKAYIDIDFVKLMPNADLIICTSIFHHWVRLMGKNKAFKLMKLIATKTNKYLLFETGQYNEIDTKWHKDLDFMGDNPKKWIKDFLIELDFTNILELGDYKTTVSEIKRTLFLCEKRR